MINSSRIAGVVALLIARFSCRRVRLVLTMATDDLEEAGHSEYPF